MHPEALPYHLVYPPNLRDWPPLKMFRGWLFDELDHSLNALRAKTAAGVKESRAPGTATTRKSARPRATPVARKDRRASRR